MAKRFSPSGLQTKKACPCFDYKEMTLKDGDTGETMAERGTRLHKAVELRDPGMGMTEDEVQQIMLAIEYVNSLIAEAGEGARVLNEEHVKIPGCDGGTLDFAVLAKGTGKLVDYKFIRTASVVKPENNLQIQSYAVGLLLKYEELEVVHATFIAPGMQFAPEPVAVTRAMIPEILEQIKELRDTHDDPFKQPTPNEYCNLCGNAARCPALGEVAVTVYNKTGLPIPETFSPESAVSPRDRGIAQMLAQALANWADETKKQNNLAAAEGAEVLGHRLVTRAGGFKITDTPGLIRELAGAPADVQLTADEALDAMSTTANKLSKIVALKYGLTDKEAREKLTSWLEVSGMVEPKPDIKYLMRVRGQDIKQLLGQ
jgi:hypothetical protein